MIELKRDANAQIVLNMLYKLIQVAVYLCKSDRQLHMRRSFDHAAVYELIVIFIRRQYGKTDSRYAGIYSKNLHCFSSFLAVQRFDKYLHQIEYIIDRIFRQIHPAGYLEKL